MSRFVVAVVATFRRTHELQRLFASLCGVDAAVVCDNSGDPAIEAVVRQSPIATEYIAPMRNLGCGGGLLAAEERAWQVFGDRLTHLLVLDDDAVLNAGTVERLAAAMDRENAAVAYPIVIGSDGRVGWTPGLKDRALHRVGRVPVDLAEYRSRMGEGFPRFDWAQGICLLARRDAVDRAGFHRADFWVRGEDLDFSLRLTAQGKGIFVTDTTVAHLPPDGVSKLADTAEYLRHAAMIQNIAYLGLRKKHGWRIANSIPGSCRRFVRMWGFRALPDAIRALWRGAILGEPAGKGSGGTFCRRFDDLVRN